MSRWKTTRRPRDRDARRRPRGRLGDMFLAVPADDHRSPAIGSAQSVPDDAGSTIADCGAIPSMNVAAAGNGSQASASTFWVPAGPETGQLRRAGTGCGGPRHWLAATPNRRTCRCIRTPGRGWEHVANCRCRTPRRAGGLIPGCPGGPGAPAAGLPVYSRALDSFRRQRRFSSRKKKKKKRLASPERFADVMR